MPTISVDVDVDVSDVLDELTDEQLREELRKREQKLHDIRFDGEWSERELLERAFYDLRGNCPSQALREYFDRTIGRIC